ncbi:MAG: hypothetical protein ACE5D0_08840 [Fidelibacterota bacterium]
MNKKTNLKNIDQEIKSLKKTARSLMEDSKSIPTIQKNTSRILSSIKMMEINICDLVDLD